MGGALFGFYGFLAAAGLSLSRSSAPLAGGGAALSAVWTVDATGAPGAATDVSITQCACAMNAGGVAVLAGARVGITRGALARNGASFLGGGAFLMFGDLELTESVVEGNMCEERGWEGKGGRFVAGASARPTPPPLFSQRSLRRRRRLHPHRRPHPDRRQRDGQRGGRRGRHRGGWRGRRNEGAGASARAARPPPSSLSSP